MAVPRIDLSALPDSAYAAELRDGSPNRRFSPALEAEYLRARLVDNCVLVRVASVLATLLVAVRFLRQLLVHAGGGPHIIETGLVLAASLALTALAWSRAYARLYLPVAQLAVPLRNAIAVIPIAAAAAAGHAELLMVLPLMVLGPFFFLGLGFRAALVSVLMTWVSFVASAVLFHLPMMPAVRSCGFLLAAVIASAIAARHLDKWARASFLESRLIAELAQHDALTGTKNRRVFDDHLADLWQRAIDDDRTIAILLIDIDHFKAYNDRYGHQAGDQILRRVAQALQVFVCQPLDILARYGGEEFVAVLYDVDARQSQAVADQMTSSVLELGIEHRGSRAASSVTISIGVAVIAPTAERKPRGALQLADEALYKAKLRGRNRVELMDEAEYKLLETGVFAQSAFVRGQ